MVALTEEGRLFASRLFYTAGSDLHAHEEPGVPSALRIHNLYWPGFLLVAFPSARVTASCWLAWGSTRLLMYRRRRQMRVLNTITLFGVTKASLSAAAATRRPLHR